MRVFVFGAGASAHAGYPVASALGSFLQKWVRDTGNSHYGDRLDQIIAAYGSLDNFESILTNLVICPPERIPEYVLPNVRRDLREMMRQCFDTVRAAPTPLYDKLSHHLKLGDVVVTFNYDMAIERALAASNLWDIGRGYGFPIIEQPNAQPTIKILKLHGSTNWREVPFGGQTGYIAAPRNVYGDRPVLCFKHDAEYLGFPEFVDPLGSRLDPCPSSAAMVMPASPKEFYLKTSHGCELENFWDGLWQQAEEAVADAEELILIGYSLPEADGRARDLLLNTANKDARLSICSGGDSERLKRLFQSNGFKAICKIPNPTFESFLGYQ